MGGILNDEAILTVSNCVLSFNSIGIYNNAAFNSGVIASVTIINSLFSDNIRGHLQRVRTSFGINKNIGPRQHINP